MVEINGMAHVILSVSEWDACKTFYSRLLPFLGMTRTFDGEEMVYHVGGRTALGISRCAPEHEGERFVQNRVGLHHLCFRARSKEDVDTIATFVTDELKAKIIQPPEPGDRFAPGYYSFLFEDPDGLRVEFNYVPGAGHFGKGGRLGEGGQGPANQYGEDGLTNG